MPFRKAWAWDSVQFGCIELELKGRGGRGYIKELETFWDGQWVSEEYCRVQSFSLGRRREDQELYQVNGVWNLRALVLSVAAFLEFSLYFFPSYDYSFITIFFFFFLMCWVAGIREKNQRFKLGWTSKVQKQKLNQENLRYFNGESTFLIPSFYLWGFAFLLHF